MIEQGSSEWHEMRLGKVTASRVKDVVAKGRGGNPSASRENYLAELVLERLTGLPPESYTNAAMQWGVEQEGGARRTYEFTKGVSVEQVAFAGHPTIEMSGASPDGLIGDDGYLEIKCPNSATHLKALRGGSPKGEYIKQIQWGLACTGRKWCDFVSFDPRFPAHLQMHVTRIERDTGVIAELESAVTVFLDEVTAQVLALEPVEAAA